MRVVSGETPACRSGKSQVWEQEEAAQGQEHE